jgi:hypothetical protein
MSEKGKYDFSGAYEKLRELREWLDAKAELERESAQLQREAYKGKPS